jgi:general secretion pathway protein J
MRHSLLDTAYAAQHRPAASSGGFTLLELMISMTLLVLIVVIAVGALRISSRSVEAGEKKMEAEERFRMVISTLDAQISSHIPLTYLDDSNKIYYFRGEKKTLRFSTCHSIWDSRRGCVIVTYKVEDHADGYEVLSAVEQIPEHEGTRQTRLLDASAISFEYYIKAAAEEQGKWVDTLSDGLTIPEKIRIRITQGSSQLPLMFPVRVAGKMTMVQGGARPRNP